LERVWQALGSVEAEPFHQHNLLSQLICVSGRKSLATRPESDSRPPQTEEYGNFMSKNTFDDLASPSPNRERFMIKLNTATELMGGGGSPSEAISETDILNFALNLEYLEAEFYTYAVEGKSITSFGIGIDGKANGENPASGGMTTGGSKVNFDNDEIYSRDTAAEIGVDERARVIR
jgi:hypothetical protein